MLAGAPCAEIPPSRLTPSRRRLPHAQVELEADGLKQEESDFNPEFIARLLPKLDWPALRQVASELGIAELPERAPPKPEEDPAFLKSVHDLVMDVRGWWVLELACAWEGARASVREPRDRHRPPPISLGLPNIHDPPCHRSTSPRAR